MDARRISRGERQPPSGTDKTLRQPDEIDFHRRYQAVQITRGYPFGGILGHATIQSRGLCVFESGQAKNGHLETFLGLADFDHSLASPMRPIQLAVEIVTGFLTAASDDTLIMVSSTWR